MLFNDCLNSEGSLFSGDSLLNRFVQSGDLIVGQELIKRRRQSELYVFSPMLSIHVYPLHQGSP